MSVQAQGFCQPGLCHSLAFASFCDPQLSPDLRPDAGIHRNIPVPGTSSAAKPQPAAKPQVKATAAAPEAAKPVTARPAQQQQQVAQKLAAKPAQNGTSVAPAQNSKPAAVDVKASSVAAAGIETTAKQQGKAEAAAPAVAANGKKAKKEKLVAQPGWTLVTSTKKKA